MYWQLVEMAIGAMNADDFEDLVYALVLLDHPDARRMGAPDAGRDTVVRLDDGTELVWQAKHHTSGINWTKCRESLDRAIGERNPQKVTFAFPVRMTEGKEPGFEALQTEYDGVELPEPWTLPTIRARLAEERAADVRRELIDQPIGVDEVRVRALLEQAADRDRKSGQATAAALRGPIAALGHADALAAGEQCEQAGDLHGASVHFADLAEAIEVEMPRVANAVLLQAARCAADDGDRHRAGDLYLRVSTSAARRGEDVAEYAASRASWLLPEAEQWRSLAAMARATWPERPDEATPVLRTAFERALGSEDAQDTVEWALALCDALAADDEWAEVRDVAQRTAALLGPIEAGDRLEIELALLDAAMELGDDVRLQWRDLLLAPVGRDRESGPLIRARFGTALARSGYAHEAAEQFADAAERWRAAGDAEDELAEAVLSEDVVAQALGVGHRLDQACRVAVAELRGRHTTPAAVAERLATQGMRAWMGQRGWEAQGRLTTAWSVHRRAGHLAGRMRVAEILHDLFKVGELWSEALPWAARSGLQLACETAARNAGWSSVRPRVRSSAPSWERGGMWEAIAATGQEATDDEIDGLVHGLLQGASDHGTSEWATVQASAAARRALATVLCGIAGDDRARALEEVVHETKTTPFPPRVTTHGLLFATDAGVCDASELIAEVYGFNDRMHISGFGLALDVVRASAAARHKAVDLAADQFPGLILCAWCDLPDDHNQVAARAQDVIRRSINRELEGHEILRPDDRGRLARWASHDQQQIVADELLRELLNPAEIGAHRHEAATGLESLAARLEPTLAASLLDELIAHQEVIAVTSAPESMASHENALFARVRMSTPAAVDQVRAAALGTLVALADGAARRDLVEAMVEQALGDAAGVVRAAAVRGWADPSEKLLRRCGTDPDPLVRARALERLDRGVVLEADDELLRVGASTEAPVGLRSTVARICRESPGQHELVVKTLRGDAHVYLRAIARGAAGDPPGR